MPKVVPFTDAFDITAIAYYQTVKRGVWGKNILRFRRGVAFCGKCARRNSKSYSRRRC
jgi:hypothetical protein